MATRNELIMAVRDRYGQARRAEKGRILEEFVAVTGFHRKHAMRVLRGPRLRCRSGPPGAADLRRGGSPGADPGVGGVGPDLRQAAQAVGANSCRGCVFRSKSARHSDLMSAADFEVMSAIPI